jgi:hypothetical protein
LTAFHECGLIKVEGDTNMKVCEKCGLEISTKDGDNLCRDCEEGRRKKESRNKARRERDSIMRSLGLVKVRGSMGGVYWE